MSTPPKKDSKSRDNHPIRLVRNSYMRCGLRDLSTAAGFSRMVGCSDSLIRNSESGIIPLSEKLAHRIENATGVSAKWLLDSADTWRRGGNRSIGGIPNKQGKPWHPSRESKFCFADELVDVAELLYERSPALLPPTVGAMMEAFLELEPPPPGDRHRTPANVRAMRKYIDSYLLPFFRLVGDLEGADKERFIGAFAACLKKRDAAMSKRLMEIWSLIDSRENFPSPSAMHPSMVPLQKEADSSAPNASKRRATKRSSSKN